MELRVEQIVGVSFRHNFFAEENHDWLSAWPSTYPEFELPVAIPTNRTQQLMSDLGLYFRKSDRGFNLFAQVKEDAGDFIAERKSNTNNHLLFYLCAPHSNWSVYTKGASELDGLVVYSNLNGLNGTGSDTSQYLHDEIPASGAGEKEPGTLVRKSNKVYEALTKTNSQPPGANWVDLGSHTNFSNLSNTFKINRGKLLVEETDLANGTVQVFDVYDNEVFSYTFDSGSTEKQRWLEIDHLIEGVYSWRYNASPRGTFLKVSKTPLNCFGVFMLYLQPNQSVIPGAHQLDEEWLPIANGSGSLSNNQINPREFTIHFLPNRAVWRYRFSRDLGIPNGDVPSEYQKIDPITYQSKKAKAITKFTKGPDFGLDVPLPAAQAGILLPQYNGGNTVENYVSEIYVNV